MLNGNLIVMKVPIDVRCLECHKIFCCAECRHVHEIKEHSIKFDCNLCRFSVFTLDFNIPPKDELMDHIKLYHLPLRCKKCERVFDKVEDFTNVERCCIIKKGDMNECDSSCAISSTVGENVVNFKRKYDETRVKNGQSEVLTSTPTHPNVPNWGIFQKSFTSTLSGINSPDSDVAQSPPNESDKIASSVQLSSIQGDSSSNPKSKELKGIIMKGERPKLGFSDSLEKQNPHIESISNGISTCDEATGDKVYSIEGIHQDLTPSAINSSDKRKKVTFAEDVDDSKYTKIKPYHVFLKPKRISTPGRINSKRSRTPRLQAIINNFESRAGKLTTPPRNMRTSKQESDITPPSTEQNIVAARTIDFKSDSPTMSDDSNHSPKPIDEKETEIKSPATSESDTSSIEHYKSCLNDSFSKTEEAVQDLPKQIADSIQETLSNALESENCTTEIQFKIVITKKIVTIKETTKSLNDFQDKSLMPGKESTTIWSRLMRGVKWVIWGDKDIESIQANTKNEGNYDDILHSTSKRKRFLSELSESPINNKRYRYSGRINGRRPLDRMLKGGIFSIERSNSAGVDMISSKNRVKNNKDVLNQSF